MKLDLFAAAVIAALVLAFPAVSVAEPRPAAALHPLPPAPSQPATAKQPASASNAPAAPATRAPFNGELTPAQQAQQQSAGAAAQAKLAQLRQGYRSRQLAQLSAANAKALAAFARLQGLEAQLETTAAYKAIVSQASDIAAQYAAATPADQAALQARANALHLQLAQMRQGFTTASAGATVAATMPPGVRAAEAAVFQHVLGAAKPVLTGLFLSSKVTPGSALILTGDNLGSDAATCGRVTVTINSHTWPVQGLKCTGGNFAAGVVAPPGAPALDNAAVAFTGLVDQPAVVTYAAPDGAAATLIAPFYALRTVTPLLPQYVQVQTADDTPVDARPQLTLGTYHKSKGSSGYQGDDHVVVPLINGWTLYQIDLHADWWGNGCYGYFTNVATSSPAPWTNINIGFGIPPNPNYDASKITPSCEAGLCDTCNNLTFVYEANIYVAGPEGTEPVTGAPPQGPDQLPDDQACLDAIYVSPGFPWYNCSKSISNF
ncbi:MAG TPA: hypothetical protein VGL58_20850 [Caulobacteraceae bacterium]|jgi:hypothetical protein